MEVPYAMQEPIVRLKPDCHGSAMPIASFALLIGSFLLAAGMTTAVWTVMAFKTVASITFENVDRFDGMVEIDWMRLDVIHQNFLLIIVTFLTASAVALVLGALLVKRYLRPGGPSP